jgi:hypothetical protein
MIILWIVLDNVKEHSTVANIAEEGMCENASTRRAKRKSFGRRMKYEI